MSASFVWALTGFGTTTTCSLDGGAFLPCASPKRYDNLAFGRHTLVIEARNRVSAVTTSHTWTIAPSGGTPPSPPGPPPLAAPPPPPGPPPPPPAATQPMIELLELSGWSLSPSRARAGFRLTLRLLLSTDNGPAVASAGEVGCTARIGRAKLRPVARAVTSSANARASASCSWRLPRGMRGRTLRVTTALSVDGVDVSQTVSRRIR